MDHTSGLAALPKVVRMATHYSGALMALSASERTALVNALSHAGLSAEHARRIIGYPAGAERGVRQLMETLPRIVNAPLGFSKDK
jgi:hypothetical protein